MPRYNIQSCATGGTAIGFSNTQPLTIGVVYKKNNVCWLVTSYIDGAQGNLGEFSLGNPDGSYAGPNACAECLPPRYNCVSGQCVQALGGTYDSLSSCQSNCQSSAGWAYTLQPCNGGQSLSAYRNTTTNDVPFGAKIVYNNQCYSVIAISQQSSVTGVNISNVGVFYSDCNCSTIINTSTNNNNNNNQQTTSSTSGYLYLATSCTTGNTINVFHNTAGNLGGRGLAEQGQCWRLQYISQQAAPPLNVLNITNRSTFDNACPCVNNIQTTPPGITSNPTKYLFQRCNTTETFVGYRNQGDLLIGNGVIIFGNCYRVTSIFGNMDNPGSNVSNAQICNCPGTTTGGGGTGGGGTGGGGTGGGFTGTGQGQNVTGNLGTTPSTLSTGYMCTIQGCVQQLYNEAAGQEPQYYTLTNCQANCQGLGPGSTTVPSNLQIGYQCTAQGCAEIYYDPATGLEPYATLIDCQTACTGGPSQPGGGGGTTQTTPQIGTSVPTIIPAAGPGPSGPTGEGDENNPPVNIDPTGTGGPPYIGPPTGPPYTTTTGTTGGGTGNGTNPNPCAPEFEPKENTVVRTVTPLVVGNRESSAPGNSLDPEAYEYLIPECWRWKYKLCARRPPNSTLGTPWQMYICLRNLGEPPEWPYPMPGTFIRFECKAKENLNVNPNAPKYEKHALYHDGYGGTYTMFIESNSVFCGFTPTPGCPSSGVLIKTYCVGVDQYGEYHDGKCGVYTEKIATNSKICGYVDPPPPPPKPQEDRTILEVPTEKQVFTSKGSPPSNIGVYVPISLTDKLDTVDIVSEALWSGGDSYLRSQNTSSLADSSSLNYILSVYDKPLTSPTCSSEIQYKIIYADYQGRGAEDLGGRDEETLTKAMYSQYAQVLLPHGQTKFNFNGEDEDYVYIIDISRNRFKQSLDPGNWQLTLGGVRFSYDFASDSILTNMMTASYDNDSLTLIDDATRTNSNNGPLYITSQIYNVKIGTIEDGLYTTYVTASVASASIARQDVSHVILPSSPSSNTAIVRGQERIPFVFPNFTTSVTASRLYGNYYNPADGVTFDVTDKLTPNRVFNPNFPYEADNRVYRGSWTGSFTMPAGYGTFSPTILSGGFSPGFDNTNPNPTFMNDGYTWIAMNVKYTTGSKVYNGYLKFALYDERNQIGSPSYFDPLYCSSCTEASWSAVPGQDPITASLSQAAFGEFRADSWYTLKDELISTASYTELPNGNILYPITSDSFGKVYPNHGIIVLSGKKLDALGLNTNRSIDKNGYNTYRLYHSMNLILKTGLTDSSGDPLGFYGRSVDIKHSTRCFVTIKNGFLNYSNNPTYVSGSEGEVISPFLNQEKAYFTSIGLYNSERELLAIGKMSKPLLSTKQDESLFTVKVTY